MYYLIGLGNPGQQYEHTRHNVGQLAVRAIADSQGAASWTPDKVAHALVTDLVMADTPIRALLPQTYMNQSGQTARYLKEKHGATPAEIIVVYDDVDLPLGEMKVSVGRGDGGHNGVKSVMSALGSKDFVRLRIGVSRTSFWTGKTVRPQGAALSRHVLARFSTSEIKKLETVYPKVEQALTLIVRDGVEKAMNVCN
jgi:PTH1 family peptidyl-tRNA hydrolase